MATLNCDGLRGSDLRAAVNGAVTPKVAALLGCIRQHDVVALQDVAGVDETAMDELLQPTHVWRWQKVASGKGTGVGFAVASSIAAVCSIVGEAHSHGGLAWLRCDGQLFSSAQPVFVANVYAPSVGTHHTVGEYAQRMAELMEQTQVFSRSGLFVWLGDFNANVGTASELQDGGPQYQTAIQLAPELHQPRAVRGAAPDRLKQQAKQFLNAAAAVGCLLLTGRKGDAGEPSFRSSRGHHSRIDHIAVHAALWPATVSCKVDVTAAGLSDHQPVVATFAPPANQGIDFGVPDDSSSPLPGPFGYQHLTWRPERYQLYNQVLQQQPTLQQFVAAVAEGKDDAAECLLKSALLAAAVACGMVRTTEPHGSKQQGQRLTQKRQLRPPWWDEEVQAAHDGLHAAALGEAPGWVRKDARRRFKSVARRHRRRYTRYVAAMVADKLAGHDAAVYREQLHEKRKQCPATAIAATAWQQHLVGQFTAVEPPPHQPSAQQQQQQQPQPQGWGVSPEVLSGGFEKAFNSMREHTAAGLDGIAAPFIKHGACLRPILGTWFTDMAGRGSMPKAWRPVRIQPIFKKNDPLNPANYRPIAITSVLYRVYASMMNTVASTWARDNGHVCGEQFGFQRRRSTMQAAFVLRHLASKQRSKPGRRRLHCCFVDFEKAYDSVSHGKLWDHLAHRLNMPASLLRAIRSMYEGAVYILQDGNKRTQPVPATRGIKQGCPLSPLLFTLFINDLPAYLQQHCAKEGIECGQWRIRCLKFADDVSLVASTAKGLQRLLDALHGYAGAKQLTVNVSKTKVLVFGGRLKRRTKALGLVYGADKQPLEEVATFPFLGLQLDETGKMAHAMEAREGPFTAALHRTSRVASKVGLGRHLPTRLKLAAVYATPVANYGDVIWGTAALQSAQTVRNRLQHQLLSHIQAVAGVPVSTPRWPLLAELCLQPMQRSWWKHIVRFYNRAVSAEGAAASPLMAAALAADIALAKEKGTHHAGHTWAAQVLAAMEAVQDSAPLQLVNPHMCMGQEEGVQHGREQPAGGGQHGVTGDGVRGLEQQQQQQRGQQFSKLVEACQPLPEAAFMRAVDAAYQQQWGSMDRRGDPRCPATPHRATATYNAWFRPSAGAVLGYALQRTSSKACAVVRANLRLRLGAVHTAVTKGRYAGSAVPFESRVCQHCLSAGRRCVDDALHVCLECPYWQAALMQQGWTAGTATDFDELYAPTSLKTAMEYVAHVVSSVSGGVSFWGREVRQRGA